MRGHARLRLGGPIEIDSPNPHVDDRLHTAGISTYRCLPTAGYATSIVWRSVAPRVSSCQVGHGESGRRTNFGPPRWTAAALCRSLHGGGGGAE